MIEDNHISITYNINIKIPYIYKLKGMSYGLLTGINLVKALGIEFGIITLASFIAYKIVNKFLKNIQ